MALPDFYMENEFHVYSAGDKAQFLFGFAHDPGTITFKRFNFSQMKWEAHQNPAGVGGDPLIIDSITKDFDGFWLCEIKPYGQPLIQLPFYCTVIDNPTVKLTVYEGTAIYFSQDKSPLPNIVYKWQKLQNGLWVDVVPPQNENIFLFKWHAEKDNAGIYRGLTLQEGAIIEDNRFEVVVNDGQLPYFPTQPKDLVVYEGDFVPVNFTANGTDFSIWKEINGVWQQYAYPITNSLFASVKLSDAGRYRAEANVLNGQTAISDIFNIKVLPKQPPKLKDFNFISQDIRDNGNASSIEGITRHAQWLGVQIAPQWQGWDFGSLASLPTIKRFEVEETSSSTPGSTPAIEMDYGLLTFRFKVDSLSPVNNSATLMVTLETSDGVAIQKPLTLNFL